MNGEQELRDLLGRRLYIQLIRVPHLLVVLEELIPIWRQRVFGNTEQEGKQFGFLVILLFLFLGQSTHVGFIHGDRPFPQSGMHPDHGVHFIRHVAAATRESTGILFHLTHDLAMNIVYLKGAFHHLIQVAEHHGEHIGEGAAETADGIIHGAGVLLHAIGNPGMGGLQQYRAPCSHKTGGMTHHAPEHTVRTKNTGLWIYYLAFHIL